MNALLTYLAGSALMLVLLWTGFRLLFYAQKTLRVNRVLLTVILAFSVTAPLLLSPVRLPVPERLPDLAGLMSVRDAVSEASVPAGQGGQEGVRLESVLTWAYAAGAVAVLFVRVLLPLLSVALLLRRGRVSVYVAGGRRIRVARVPGAAPMSWMGIVILPSGKEFGDDSCVLRHELAHVLLGHSPVILFSSLLLCLQWFNPAAWMLLRDLEQNCEFEADDAVLRSGADRCGYQMELVGRASDGRSLPLASMFRHSGLFRRIWMIQKEMPASRVYLRLMYVLPVTAAAVLFFSTPSGEIRAHGAVRETGPQAVIGREQPSLSMERDVTSPFERWLMDSIEYSDSGQTASEVSLKCTFRTGPDGQVRNAMIMLRGADNEGSARSMLMDAVVNMPPVWSPGRIGEEPVSLSQELPLMLQMSTRS